MDSKLLQGKVALVTGGGSGIGKGLALAFAREGVAIAMTGRRPEPLNETVALVQKAGGRALAIPGDVSVPAACKAAVDACVKHFGQLDILINNAGIARWGTLEQSSDEDIARMLNINMLGPILMAKYATPHLVARKPHGGGSIINIASGVADSTVQNFSVYSATKAGLVHFTKCLAHDLAADRVRVNCINPGVVETPIFATMMPAAVVDRAMQQFSEQTPLGRVGQPKDIAGAALFLASAQAEWITGAVLSVDGGLSLV